MEGIYRKVERDQWLEEASEIVFKYRMSIGGCFCLKLTRDEKKGDRGVVPERLGLLDTGMTDFDVEDFSPLYYVVIALDRYGPHLRSPLKLAPG